jgi:integrase
LEKDAPVGKKSLEKSGSIRYLTRDDWRILEKAPSSMRDSLILRILYETGCTVNELVNIKRSHCDFVANTVRIRPEHARNHANRVAYISERLSKDLQSYGSLHEGEYILSGRQGEGLTTKRIRQLVQKYCEQCGIHDAGPQVLRYTHIVHAYQKNIPLQAIQRQVGLRRSRAIDIFQELPELGSKDAYRKFIE